MASYWVQCVKRVDIGNGEMVIDKLSLNEDGERGSQFLVTKSEAIELIEAGNRIYTFVRTDHDDGYETDLEVAIS